MTNDSNNNNTTATKNMKYHELLTRFPYAKKFAFNGGQHVNFIIKNL